MRLLVNTYDISTPCAVKAHSSMTWRILGNSNKYLKNRKCRDEKSVCFIFCSVVSGSFNSIIRRSLPAWQWYCCWRIPLWWSFRGFPSWRRRHSLNKRKAAFAALIFHPFVKYLTKNHLDTNSPSISRPTLAIHFSRLLLPLSSRLKPVTPCKINHLKNQLSNILLSIKTTAGIYIKNTASYIHLKPETSRPHRGLSKSVERRDLTRRKSSLTIWTTLQRQWPV